MQLSELLKPDAVRIIAESTSKKRLFQKLGEVAHNVYDCPTARICEALMERETLGPTAVGHGIALPHARVAGISQLCGLFFKLDKPMDFEAVDRQPVDLVFALVAPEDAGVHHLKALAAVSRTMRDPAICAKLRANQSPDTLHTVLTAGPATAAA
ncbi:MAG: PTS sugar transporter subunit IIA [Pseudomonadota bacterium]